MKASEASLLEFLKKSEQLTIPIYQRTYSWTERECSQLWDDILTAGENKSVETYFIGPVVYIEKGLIQVTVHPPWLVIDGQQRLTTVALIIEALARCLGTSGSVEGFSADKLRQYYLINPLESGECFFKLVLTETDKKSLFALMSQKDMPDGHSIRIKENFAFFEQKMQSKKTNLTALFRGLRKLVVVDVSLDRGHDNPQLIFESMNSTGRELTQGDLIRNFLLMGLDIDTQTRLYEDHWRPMEKAFKQDAYGRLFSRFIRDYLTLHNDGEIPVMRRVYETFKTYAKSKNTEALVADVHKHAVYYCAMALGKENDGEDDKDDKELAAAFSDLVEFKADVAFPLLLKMYRDCKKGLLEKEDFREAVRMTESYVFRRAACGIPTNSLNQTFSVSLRAIDEKRYLESIKAYFLNLSSYRRFPRDEEFKRELSNRDLYNFPRRSYWLRRLENHEKKEFISPSNYTIEHIMPQNKNLSEEWRRALGDDWERLQEKYLHTLGNLTLTGYNPEYSDLSFDRKRDMEGGFRSSPLWLNKGMGDVDIWNEDAILKRAERLAERAVEVWALPHLPEDTLKTYKTRSKMSGKALPDGGHPAFTGASEKLFESFRKEVSAIDDCVGEETLAGSVVYRAETDFAEVLPRSGNLVVLLNNVRLHELRDPEGLARSATERGRLSNCEAEIVLEKIEHLPHVVALVRQTFERQIQDADNDA